MIVIILVAISACGSENKKPQRQTATEPTVSQQQFDEQSNLLAQYQRADSVRSAENKVNQEMEDSLNAINLTPLGILSTWNGKKVKDVITPGSYSLHGIHSVISTLFGETGFEFLLKSLMANPALWQKTASDQKTRIAWFKEKLSASIDVDILPYLKDEYSSNGFQKQYVPYFKAFYAIHSKSDIDGVWYHPKWQQFEEDFFKKFPNAYAGDHQMFGNSYKLWLQTTRLSAPAKKALGSILEICNNPNP
ncbi:MAG: hypothetical protein WCL18_03035 [bacterium]